LDTTCCLPETNARQIVSYLLDKGFLLG
jgi:hypothetical protein